ncbi:MAG: hypothetical protein WC683_10555 [bacterium]
MNVLRRLNLLLIVAALLIAASAAHARSYDLNADFYAFDKDRSATIRRFEPAMSEAQRAISRSEVSGRPMPCSRQILLETRWLADSTSDYERLRRRMDELRRSLRKPNQGFADEQAPSDGSWGRCFEEWFLKFNTSVDFIRELQEEGRTPAHRTSFLDRINSPESLSTYLHSLLISDITATGKDSAKELNYAATGLLRLLLNGAPADYPYHPSLKDALLRFIDDEWQNSDTGYWGEWYLRVGEPVKTDHLSTTFHIISYRKGDVRRWKKIIDTTLAIKGLEYPFGWLEHGGYSNHHNYDVVKIFRYGWPHMNRRQQATARDELRAMIRWCLQSSLKPDGSFVMSRTGPIGESFYFGVAFLNEVGYFERARRFWTDEEFHGVDDVRAAILRKIDSIKYGDLYMKWAREMLIEAGGEQLQ